VTNEPNPAEDAPENFKSDMSKVEAQHRRGKAERCEVCRWFFHHRSKNCPACGHLNISEANYKSRGKRTQEKKLLDLLPSSVLQKISFLAEIENTDLITAVVISIEKQAEIQKRKLSS